MRYCSSQRAYKRNTLSIFFYEMLIIRQFREQARHSGGAFTLVFVDTLGYTLVKYIKTFDWNLKIWMQKRRVQMVRPIF
jgi:hypothetical protein